MQADQCWFIVCVVIKPMERYLALQLVCGQVNGQSGLLTGALCMPLV